MKATTVLGLLSLLVIGGIILDLETHGSTTIGVLNSAGSNFNTSLKTIS